MHDGDMFDSARAAGAPIEQAVAVFMLHPETLAESIAAGYANPLAGYVAGRGGVLGEASGGTVSSVFAVFEPTSVCALWEEGIAVRGAAGAAALYWEQTAGFGRRYLTRAEDLGRFTELGEKVIEAAPDPGLPLYAGWRAMPLAADPPARALQVMFVLRELRGNIHFNALTISGVSPVEAHMLNKGPDYTRMFGWSEPFPDGADKKDRYAAVEETTNRRMGEIFGVAFSHDEAVEFARRSADILACLRAAVPQ